MKTDTQWIRETLEHSSNGAVPYNFMFAPHAERIAKEHYGENLADSLSMPVRMSGLKSIKPAFPDPEKCGPTVTDEFGVAWATNALDRGAPLPGLLPEPDLSKYTFPDARVAYRFEDVPAWCAKNEGHFRIIWVGDLWERATFMRGMEEILLDLAMNPGFVEELLEGLTRRILETIEVLATMKNFECIAVSDDYGTQRGMIMSPDQWRKLIKPCLAKIYGLAKSHGLSVFHHSCGSFVPVIGDMIDLGLDILHPIQPEAMDILSLKKEFGDRVTFCGGVSTQGLLVSGTPEQVQNEVRRLKHEMGRNGGYILEPGITLQADVPRENLIALIDEARAS